MAYTTIDKPTDYFETVTYTGNGVDDRDITGLDFQPDMLWSKRRDSADNHSIYDIVRGDTKELRTQSTGAELVRTDNIQALNSNGFQVGTDSQVNASGGTYVSWGWSGGGTASSNTDGSTTTSISANTNSGFSIVSWTGTGSATTLGHGLNSKPEMIFIKNRDATQDWVVYNSYLSGTEGHKALYLDLNYAETDQTGFFNDTAATSSVFTVGSNGNTNNSGDDFIAYCFHSVKSYSKMGSYTGNGSTTDGTFVYTGHSVAWVMIKQSNEARDWVIYDNKRDAFNVKDNFIVPNSSNAEGSGNTSLQIDFLSNGFKLRGGNHALNKSGGSYIYMAFAESPFTTSTGIPTTAR
jgi:hypothetical protein